MNIGVRRDGGKLVMMPVGRIDAKTAPEFEHELGKNLSGIDDLVIDLGEVDYLSSAGLRVILYAQKIMNNQGSMKVINVNDDVMDILEVTGFAQIITFA